jgi:hypothetical protein
MSMVMLRGVKLADCQVPTHRPEISAAGAPGGGVGPAGDSIIVWLQPAAAAAIAITATPPRHALSQRFLIDTHASSPE